MKELLRPEHVWNATCLAQGCCEAVVHHLLRGGASRSGGDLLCVGRVT